MNEVKISRNERHKPDQDRHFFSEVWDWAKSIIIALVVVLLLNHFVFHLSTVDGQSMEPTLHDKEWLFVNRAVYLLGEPEAGDVVIIRDPRTLEGKKQYLVKRVVAVPGDTVEINDRKLIVNGEVQAEPHIDAQNEDGDFAPVKVGEGDYFVMGDNRHLGQSLDSRSFGTVPSELILGRADFILWPLSKLGGVTK